MKLSPSTIAYYAYWTLLCGMGGLLIYLTRIPTVTVTVQRCLP